MPNYRYNMPEYERRNNRGNYPQSISHRQYSQGCNAARESQASVQSCNAVRESQASVQSSRESVRNSCEVSRRERRETGEMSCAVSENYDALAGMPLAMAYVPWQMWRKIYDAEKALCQGTIFEELDKPFQGRGGIC